MRVEAISNDTNSLKPYVKGVNTISFSTEKTDEWFFRRNTQENLIVETKQSCNQREQRNNVEFHLPSKLGFLWRRFDNS